MSAVVIHELYYGAFKSQRVEKNVARVDGLQFPVLEFDQEDARQAGEIRAHLASKGTPIGRYDVLIAGQAMLRHTFCSHLAMRGAAPRAIQELAGHRDFGTTQRYIHLSPAAAQSAIQLLEEAAPSVATGDIAETGNATIRKVNG